MRGLGIGMVVTALILGVSLRNHTAKMTDAEVIQRAEEMGMEQKYESGTLADLSAQQKKDSEEPGSKETKAGENPVAEASFTAISLLNSGLNEAKSLK